jgi:ABC-type dipeptide/oligopeptide/nickel transport system permease component
VRFLGGRMLQGCFVVLGSILISFIMINIAGSPAVARSGGLFSAEQIAALEQRLGYDRPILERFGEYLTNVLRGDFGVSYRFGDSAATVVLDAIPYTLLLVAGAVLVALAFALVVAVHSVIHRESRADRVLRTATLVGQGVPEFWLALMLVLVFSVWLGALPSLGFDDARSLVLPVVALAVPLCPALLRILRSQLLDIMEQEFIVALRAKGLSARAIVLRHALRNALPGFVTFLALQIGWLIGGTLIVEVVFAWPGVGTVLHGAVVARDLLVIQAVVVLLAVTYVLLNLLADAFVLWIDPRIRTGRL